MKLTYKLSIALLLSAAALFAAAPAPNAVQNSASETVVGNANYGIAQGSIMVIYGSNMGPASLVQATQLPYTTSLGGTSVSVTVNSTTTNALMIYTVASQLAAILPSNTPVGTGTLTVTYNSVQGSSTPITVVASQPGVFTVNQTGTGPGIATHVSNQLITATNAAGTGEEIQIYATGLGPVPVADDANSPGGVQFSTANLLVYVGGTQLQASAIKYYGRNPSDPGLDQINIILPPNVTGCTVSLVFQNGSGNSAVVSNTTTLSIASTSGGTCSDPNGVSLSGLSGAINSGSVSVGSISLQQSSYSFSENFLRPRALTNETSASGYASFQKYTSTQFESSGTSYIVSIGSCIIAITNSNITTSPITAVGLDAGPQIAVLPPTGSTVDLVTNTAVGKGYYSSPFSGAGAFTQISPGTYQFTGTGGADVGAFTVMLKVPVNLTWTNEAAVTGSPIVRSSGLTLTWSGGDPSSYVYILGASANPTASGGQLGASFYCIAPIAPGSFTIPPPVLLSLPATSSQEGALGLLLLGTQSSPVAFTAPAGTAAGATALNLGFASSESTTGSQVTWQ